MLCPLRLYRYSGPTIHYVDEQYDTGCILAQRVVPVLAKDTAEELAARVLHEVCQTHEHSIIFFFFYSCACHVQLYDQMFEEQHENFVVHLVAIETPSGSNTMGFSC